MAGDVDQIVGPVPAQVEWRSPLARVARSVALLRSLTESDLRYRYGRGPGRFLRWLMEPFALVGVYLLFLTFVLDRPGDAPGLSLAAVIVPFQLVISTVGNAVDAVLIRRPILLNMAFERNLIPISSALTECASFVASFLIIVVMMAAYRIAPSAALLWLPLVALVNLYVAVAAAYAASLLGLWLRELRLLLLSFVRMLFFLSPALVPLAQTSPHIRGILRLNPLTGLFEAYRDIFLLGHDPSAWQLLYPIGIASLILLLFVPLYCTEQGEFAKVV